MKTILNNKNILTSVKNSALVVLGTLVLAFGAAVFIIPFDLVTGGITGLAIILDEIIKAEFITIDLIITVITWLTFLLGAVILGKDFALKTLISTITYPFAISLFLQLASPDALGGYLDLAGSSYGELALILGSVVGGGLVGIGCALAFLGGGSTGGVDIIAFVICKFFPRLKSSKVIFVIDALIVTLGIFIINDLIISLLGVLSATVAAIMIDKVFLGGKRALVAKIVSEKYDEINRLVIEKMDRTTTIIDVTGGYSLQNKKMLMVSFTMREYTTIMNIVNETDKYAFVTIHRAHEINGEGWTR
ncbi:MAG: YitT family protein [Ruminococcaceae bacterium]|nr:YitT family protein [Oscillospiraceae bacterium]